LTFQPGVIVELSYILVMYSIVEYCSSLA
jgi:hypothetical protein